MPKFENESSHFPKITPEQIQMACYDIDVLGGYVKNKTDRELSVKYIFNVIDNLNDLGELRKIKDSLDKDTSNDVKQNYEQLLRLDDIKRRVQSKITKLSKPIILKERKDKDIEKTEEKTAS